MKKVLLLTSIFLATITLFSQEWNTDIEIAKKVALEKDQKIILVFQGSDWCAPCIKLDKQIWSTETFKTYAKTHYVMLQADFPRKKANRLEEEQQRKNNQLAERYNKNGYFPHVVVLNAQGKVLGQTGYKPISPTEYIALLNSF